jgi:hypothetical protein
MKSIMMKLFNPEGIIKSKKFEMINAETAAEITRKSLEFREDNRIFELRYKIQEAALEGRFSVNTVRFSYEDKQILLSKGFVLTMPRERDMDYIRISW